MGVHGMWDLLAPVGRRVSVETLAGKKLAIDASIWMIQFMKAMRDEKGEMIRNAHILGFFRRICKLLYLRTKPVFVFDGATPALKRRTVIARRRQRENAQAKIRKTAEKLLLNHLRTMRAKELADSLQKQRQENDTKGKRPIIQESTNVQNTEKGNDAGVAYSQEEVDEMLAASLAVEENEGNVFDASTSGDVHDSEIFRDGEEDDEEDEEIILPEMQGKVDPAVLAALPPSLQLDLLVQMRERLMAENRQKYQKVKKAPARFSELQIQAYLKTVAFRREIDVVQKSAAGRGIGGIQTSRIASEANREFIFSSSFTGDKQALMSTGQVKVAAEQSQATAVNKSTEAGNKGMQAKTSGNVAGSADVETGKAFPDDVETYLDDRGQLRVSRLRALGIRMTRDLQRNLDLMKEMDKEKVVHLAKSSECNTAGPLGDNQENSCDRNRNREIIDNNNDVMDDEVDKTEVSAVPNGTSMEISFEDMVEHGQDYDEDELFARLVSGDPVIDFSVVKSTPGKQSVHSDSDVEWEEGDVVEKRTENMFQGSMNDKGEVQWEEGFVDSCRSNPDVSLKPATKGAPQEEVDFGKQSLNFGSNVEREEGGVTEGRTTYTLESSVNDMGDVEWEEGFQDIQESSSFPDESKKTVTKGALEEEADLQEAIKRSLEDMKDCRSMTDINEDLISKRSLDVASEHAGWVSSYVGKEGHAVEASDKNNVALKNLAQDAGGSGTLAVKILATSDARSEEEELCMTEKQPKDICSEDGHEQAVNKKVDTCRGELAHDSCGSGLSSSFTDSLTGRLLDSGSIDARCTFPRTLDDGSFNTTKHGNISADDLLSDAGGAKELADETIHGSVSMEKVPEEPIGNSSFVDDIQEYDIMKDHLDEEMLFLGKEREDLSIEQQKLERNAESVSSEMFAECQELLQMFGLPYIIAPMEAEAQCAFMEMSNLVDGVVTDDSDAFLFGAQSVYKNIFDDRKYVETYLMKDIENELGLDREKLIHMALLLGSDYTEGISGIGIVNAIEVVNAFPEKDGLREFREWIESPDPAILGKLNAEPGSNSRSKGSKSSDQNVPATADDGLKIKQIFMDKHRNVSKNWHIPSNFPSDAVISAYASPQVDKSTESFAWGKPDLHVLRKLCWEKFGWGTTKADELLLPVLKEYNKHETQLRLEAFYSFNERFAKIRSKRIKKAVKGIVGVKSSELMDEKRPQKPGSGKKRKVKHGEDGSGVCSTDDQNNSVEDPTGKKEKRGKKNIEQRSGTRMRKKNSCSTDGSGSEKDDEIQFEKREELQEVRRSGRRRNSVNYNEETEIKEGYLTTVEESRFIDQIIAGINEKNEGNESEQDYIMDKTTTGQTSDPQNQKESSKEDYLWLGGGFCVEEDEQTDTHLNVSSPTREMETEPKICNVSETHEIDPSATASIPRLSDPELNMNDDDNDPDIDSGECNRRSLRAMPNLRRKKKKRLG